jgi:transposase InsO family protein
LQTSCWSSSGFSIAADGRQVHAEATARPTTRRSAVVHLPEEPCQGDSRVRLLRGCHRDVPDAVRVCCHRARHASTGPRQCDSEPERGLDVAAVACGRRGRRRASVLIHDRDKIFAKHLDASIRALGLEVLRSPVASPKANSVCERVIGTIRRECLDWMIPLSEAHLRCILKSWVEHYNRGRPHSMLGPGVPDPPRGATVVPKSESRHRLAAGALVLAQSVLGGVSRGA